MVWDKKGNEWSVPLNPWEWQIIQVESFKEWGGNVTKGNIEHVQILGHKVAQQWTKVARINGDECTNEIARAVVNDDCRRLVIQHFRVVKHTGEYMLLINHQYQGRCQVNVRDTSKILIRSPTLQITFLALYSISPASNQTSWYNGSGNLIPFNIRVGVNCNYWLYIPHPPTKLTSKSLNNQYGKNSN